MLRLGAHSHMPAPYWGSSLYIMYGVAYTISSFRTMFVPESPSPLSGVSESGVVPGVLVVVSGVDVPGVDAGVLLLLQPVRQRPKPARLP